MKMGRKIDKTSYNDEFRARVAFFPSSWMEIVTKTRINEDCSGGNSSDFSRKLVCEFINALLACRHSLSTIKKN